jgi:nitrite reductase (NO-forming)
MKKKVFHYSLSIIVLSFFGFTMNQSFDLEASIERGRAVYDGQCATCHMTNGTGIPTVYPPLAKADFLMNEANKSIVMILQGGSEAITVNGIEYNGVMPNFNLSDEQVSDVMNFIRNTWGNKGEPIKPEHIKVIREKEL